jgi:hypothetical protein
MSPKVNVRYASLSIAGPPAFVAIVLWEGRG